MIKCPWNEMPHWKRMVELAKMYTKCADCPHLGEQMNDGCPFSTEDPAPPDFKCNISGNPVHKNNKECAYRVLEKECDCYREVVEDVASRLCAYEFQTGQRGKCGGCESCRAQYVLDQWRT
jgi:hypothetical protein